MSQLRLENLQLNISGANKISVEQVICKTIDKIEVLLITSTSRRVLLEAAQRAMLFHVLFTFQDIVVHSNIQLNKIYI